MPALFLSFDGVDGAGKTTQMELFCGWLRDNGHDVVTCRDPGSTELGEAVRKILLGRHDTPIHRRSEMLLYMAARAQLVEQIIRPALDAEKIVVSDRYLLANVVYQGHARGLAVDEVWQIGSIATKGLSPDLTFLLDIDVEAASLRRDGSPDRMEAEGTKFLERVRQGFLDEADRHPHEIVVIDAGRDVQPVQNDIRRTAQAYFAYLNS